MAHDFISKLKSMGLPEPATKYNHYHDARGRFSSSHGASFVSLPKPGSKSTPGQMKEHQAGGGAPGGASGGTAGDAKGATGGSPEPRGHIEDPASYSMTKELGIDEETEARYRKAVTQYTDVGMYEKIRSVQAGEKIEGRTPGQVKAIKNMGDNLEEFIAKSPKWNGGELYRGIIVDNDFSKGFKVNSTFDMKGTSSWSSEKSTAVDFANESGSVNIIFKLKGTKKGTSVRHVSAFEEQDEVIISKTAKFKVNSITKDKWHLIAEVEEVR